MSSKKGNEGGEPLANSSSRGGVGGAWAQQLAGARCAASAAAPGGRATVHPAPQKPSAQQEPPLATPSLGQVALIRLAGTQRLALICLHPHQLQGGKAGRRAAHCHVKVCSRAGQELPDQAAQQ